MPPVSISKLARCQIVAILCVLLPCSSALRALEVELDLGISGGTLITPGDLWHLFRGTEAPSDPPGAWKESDFVPTDWPREPSGFGYGDGDDETVLDDMEDGYTTIFIRTEFEVSEPLPEGVLVLEVVYDDGFVAFLNGEEVARENVEGDVTHETEAEDSHEADSVERFVLGPATEILQPGRNVLAISGHNTSPGSSDFSLIPGLRVESAASAPILVEDGDRWISSQDRLELAVTPEVEGAVSIRLTPGGTLDPDPDTGDFNSELPLEEGVQEILVEALDVSGGVLESRTIRVVLLSPADQIQGVLSESTTWPSSRDALWIPGDIIVPDGVSLVIEEGLTLLLGEGASIFVFGSLEVRGSEGAPVRFTAQDSGALWGNLVFDDAEQARVSHAIIERCQSESEYQGQDYFGAVEARACDLVIDHTTFRDLPVSGASDAPQGDAITLIEGATGRISHCSFLSIGEGVHSDHCYARIEYCRFENITGDNDGVDLEGESDPPSEVLYCEFLGSDDDAINPTGCSAIIVGNVIADCNDHGMVLRNRAFPVVMNNLLVNCGAAGIAIENQNEALLINNTIVGSGRGLRLFDLGRPELDPGGGIATAINCIIWDCPRPVTIEDDSVFTARYCIIEGDSPWPGEGNSNEDPRFVSETDFHLLPDSPARDAGTAAEAPPGDLEENERPCGGGIDLGAYEHDCDDPPPPEKFIRGDANGDRVLDLGDALFTLLHLFRGLGPVDCEKALDVNDDAVLDLADVIGQLEYQFRGGLPPAPPFPNCDEDPTPDSLPCSTSGSCP